MLHRVAFLNLLTRQVVPRRIGSCTAAPQTLYATYRYKCSHRTLAAADGPLPPTKLPEDMIDMQDPQLLQQINDILKELDPDMLLDDTSLLMQQPLSEPLQAQGMQQQQERQQPEETGSSLGATATADAWRGESEQEETEAGLPDNIVLTRAEYQRKAAVLVELLTAVHAEAAGQDVLQQKLAAFRVEVDEALLHMMTKRLEAARQLEQDETTINQLELLQSLLTVEYERAQATPALRLLDEVLDLLGEDNLLPGGKQRAEAVVARLRNAFTGGASEDVDIFAAAAALAADKALAADALTVEFVPQAAFLSEGMELLQQAKDEMKSLSMAVEEAQSELQQVRNKQPQLLETPEAQQHMQQVAHADEVLQRRKAAVLQLAYVLDLAQDLDAAERMLAGGESTKLPGEWGDVSMEQLAALLGADDA